jgi:hypothetical protein
VKPIVIESAEVVRAVVVGEVDGRTVIAVPLALPAPERSQGLLQMPQVRTRAEAQSVYEAARSFLLDGYARA